MDGNHPIAVWNEITISESGIGITLYSEGEDGACVEDETWFTHAELEDMAGDIVSLKLSEESQSELRDGRDAATEKRISEWLEEQRTMQSESRLQVGDIVVDDNCPSWSDDSRVRIDEILSDVRADEYIIQGDTKGEVLSTLAQSWNDKTVADANPSYPEDDIVVIGHYIDGGKDYAFPASRLTQPDN